MTCERAQTVSSGPVASGGNRFPGPDRRRHFRVEGEWDVRVAAVEETGAVSEFTAKALNISMGGVLLETVVAASWRPTSRMN